MEVTLERKVERGEAIDLYDDLNTYDHIIISLSGGKDSVAILLKFLSEGVDPSKLEVWHQSIDGGPEEGIDFLDWPVTESYVQAVGDHFGIPVSFQWRQGGFYGELVRQESRSGDVYSLSPDGEMIYLPTTKGKETTRMKWPAMTPDLSRRWCSAYVKIDVFRRVLNNHPRYKGTKENPKRILVCSGERREESPNRAKYLEAEIHACNTQSRIVHAYRPVIDWSERDVWDLYEKYRLLPHMAYLLGWNRTSCFGCIYSTPDLWAMMREIAPERFYRLVEQEKLMNHTIDNKLTLEEKANLGSLDRLPKDARLSAWVQQALSRDFQKEDLIVDKWELPAGAMRGFSGGPV